MNQGMEGIHAHESSELVRMIHESLLRSSSSSITSKEDGLTAFFSTPEGKRLLQDLSNRMQAYNDRNVEESGCEDTSGSSSSPPEKNASKAVTKQEEELQRLAEQVNERDPGESFLQRMFENLKHPLKQCLLCLAAFPADQIIKKRTIIYWWIGEGLASDSRDGRTAEEVGEDYFKMLIERRLIQPIHQKLSATPNYCKIYPWVRRMLVSKAKKAEFQDRPILSHDRFGRACLEGSDERASVAVSPEGRVNGCVSLFNANVHFLRCDPEKLEKFKEISSLQLGRWQNLSTHHVEVANESFLSSLKSLTKLRYLSLHGMSRISKLPDSIETLTQLLILDLRSCHNLKCLPPEVKSLTSLTHLDVSGCFLLESMPGGMGDMTNLQVLKGFVVGDEHSCPLEDLNKLQNLRKLSICIENNEQFRKVFGLRNMGRLRSLRITWNKLQSSSPATEMGISPFQFLEKLALECVPNDDSLSWLEPSNFPRLTRLYIEGGKLSQLNLGDGVERWKIEILRLKFLKNLTLEWVNVTREMQNLSAAEIIDCPEIRILDDGFDREENIWKRHKETNRGKEEKKDGKGKGVD